MSGRELIDEWESQRQRHRRTVAIFAATGLFGVPLFYCGFFIWRHLALPYSPDESHAGEALSYLIFFSFAPLLAIAIPALGAVTGFIFYNSIIPDRRSKLRHAWRAALLVDIPVILVAIAMVWNSLDAQYAAFLLLCIVLPSLSCATLGWRLSQRYWIKMAAGGA